MSARLMATLVKDWERFDGLALMAGLPDLRTLPFARVSNFVYAQLTREGDEQGIAKFRAKLWQPPAGVEADPRSPWSPANETKALQALGAGLGLATIPAPNSAA